jgi:hypothetical protein
MAITRKGQTASKGLPTKYSNLVREAATYKATADFFTALYDGGERCSDEEKAASAKGRLQAYLDAPECPIQVSVGNGGGKNAKVDGVAGLSFSQPERVDNAAAVAALVAALKDGSLQPDALTEVISTVNKDALLKALPNAEGLVTVSEKITVTMRIAGEFRAEVCGRLAAQVKQATAPAAEVTLVQPRTALDNMIDATAKDPSLLEALAASVRA